MSRLTKDQSDLVKRGQGWKCKKCGVSIKSGGRIHHKDGDSKDNKISNLVALYAKCHRQIKTRKGEAPRCMGTQQTENWLDQTLVTGEETSCRSEYNGY